MDTGSSTETKESLAHKNAEHFDKVAPGEWPEWVRILHRQIVSFLQSEEFSKWAGLDTETKSRQRMLDYACGDGVVSRALKPRFASVVGVDVSAAMLDKFRATAADLKLGPEKMVGVRGDFLSDDTETAPTEPPLPTRDLWNFDLAAISMALHHIENPEKAIAKLAGRLKPGGKLLVIDWTPLNGSTPAQKAYMEEVERNGDAERIRKAFASHAAAHTVSRDHGFTYEEQKGLFAKAGCGDFQWKLAEELTYIPTVDAKAQLYWAIGTKAA